MKRDQHRSTAPPRRLSAACASILLLAACGERETARAGEGSGVAGLEEAVEETMLEIDASGELDLEQMSDEHLADVLSHLLDEMEQAVDAAAPDRDELPVDEWREDLGEARGELEEITAMEHGVEWIERRERLIRDVLALRAKLEEAGLKPR